MREVSELQGRGVAGARGWICLAGCLCLAAGAQAAMSSADAIRTVLNSKTAVSAKAFAEAKAIVEREAAEGYPLQQFVIGVTTDNRALAEKYLNASREKIKTLAETKDNALAWYLLSMDTNDIKLLQKAAKGGNVQALNALGTIAIQKAVGSETVSPEARDRILKRSYDYFRKAAAQRDPNGFINLGTCYLRGFGCKQDLEMAFACFKSAAEAGHPEGMDNVSACYQFGHGVKKNNELCLYWAMRGRAIRGDEAATKWLRERK